MVEQLELYRKKDTGGIKEPKKFKWQEFPTFWRRTVLKTEKEHLCARCDKVIPIKSLVEITVDLNGKRKPDPEDYKNTRYWHPGGKCPEPRLSE